MKRIRHSRPTKFRPIRYISDNITITAEIEKQLRDGVSRADVKITLRLTHIKELNRKSIHELYEHMRKIPEVITKAAGFNKA